MARERDNEKWGSSMPSSSRRGSYTSGNNSSHSSIDSTGLSHSTPSQSRSASNLGEYETLYGATLFLDGLLIPANKAISSLSSTNSLMSPPQQERTLTRTQDFMVVPSEIVYGPGGEKINKGIAYTALDGRMSSTFKIPVNSSYQEEVEARRQKREKAMMKSKLMRPSTERSVGSGGSTPSGGNRPSRPASGKTKEKEKGKDSISKSALASPAGSGNPSRKRFSEKGGRLSSGENSGIASLCGSPQSSANMSNHFLCITRLQSLDGSAPPPIPRGGTSSGIPSSAGSRRRESINSLGSFDSVREAALFYTMLRDATLCSALLCICAFICVRDHVVLGTCC
jgi:hypothetical protein